MDTLETVESKGAFDNILNNWYIQLHNSRVSEKIMATTCNNKLVYAERIITLIYPLFAIVK